MRMPTETRRGQAEDVLAAAARRAHLNEVVSLTVWVASVVSASLGWALSALFSPENAENAAASLHAIGPLFLIKLPVALIALRAPHIRPKLVAAVGVALDVCAVLGILWFESA